MTIVQPFDIDLLNDHRVPLPWCDCKVGHTFNYTTAAAIYCSLRLRGVVEIVFLMVNLEALPDETDSW